MTGISLHVPRRRRPILTVGHLRMLVVLADLAIFAAIIWAVL